MRPSDGAGFDRPKCTGGRRIQSDGQPRPAGDVGQKQPRQGARAGHFLGPGPGCGLGAVALRRVGWAVGRIRPSGRIKDESYNFLFIFQNPFEYE